MPQEPGFYRGFSAFDLVDYVAVLKEMSERSSRTDEVRRVLTAVDLGDVMHKKIRALSGGQRQHVALATALLGTPDLLVLDEPATGLDPAQRLQLRSLLSEHGRHRTVVLSTHHTVEVAAFCQRVIVMLRGRVHFDGTPAELAQLAAGRVWIDHDGNAASEQAWISADGTAPRDRGSATGGGPGRADDRRRVSVDRDGRVAPMTDTAVVSARPRRERRARHALVAVEARRSLTAPWLWLGMAATMWFAYNTTTTTYAAGGYRGLMASFAGVAAGLFVLAVNAGGRDHTIGGPVAPDAAVDADDRALGRLIGLWPAIGVAVLLAGAMFAVQRLEGGMRIADWPKGGNEAVYSIVEMLQPPILFVVATTAGVALGRASAHRVVVSVAGALFIAATGVTYWAWQWVPAVWVTPIQTQPVEVRLASDFSPDSAPSTWMLSFPDQYESSWGRVTVHHWMAGWHLLYLIGLACLFAGLAIRGRRGRVRDRHRRRSGRRRHDRLDHRHAGRRRGRLTMDGLAWATPTRRAMRWRPMLATASCIATIVLAMWAADAPPAAESPEMLGVAVLVAAAALTLDDPAHALVAATPVGFTRRLAHRLAWLGPMTVGCLLAIGWIAARSEVAPVSAHMLVRATALGSLAVVTHVLVVRRRPDVAAAAAAIAPAVVVTLGVSTPRDAVGGTLAHLWLDRPWTVIGCATAIVVVIARRR